MNSGTAKLGSLEDSTNLLQNHLLAISEAIARTRREIADLRDEQEAGRTRDELQAVVRGTEQATNTILTASETVDALAGGIAKRAGDGATRDDAIAIQAQMQTIFEACNFQDLTGQRISKVVRTIVMVEERVDEMLRVWSGPAGAAVTKPVPDRRSEEDSLLNGPALPGEAAVSQDAVDAMFP
ncbi:protein phosphatase CheZ [Methylobacterium sp. SyP6R]|uniref:protein phosphatase CheZ n=1 Tax=Methylobacterium sp. SyP6R TaxID=2718876 RepID=UPI001F487AE7|nr:protein phosphatase CheZ [Methylobacterium sp. SyP6R]MCF4128978.1 protein phosphatase CheZ [Methylobacterium sp. SyP6R]